MDKISSISEKLEALVMNGRLCSKPKNANQHYRRRIRSWRYQQYPRYRLIVACHTNGINPIDGPYADVKDITGLKLDSKNFADWNDG